jgi:hypothetical protein
MGVLVMGEPLLRIRRHLYLEGCLGLWLLGRVLQLYWGGEIEAGAEVGEKKSFPVGEGVGVILKTRNMRRVGRRRRVVARLTLC